VVKANFVFVYTGFGRRLKKTEAIWFFSCILTAINKKYI